MRRFCTENLIYLISKPIYMALFSVNQETTPCIADILHVNHMPVSSISDQLLLDILCMEGIMFNIKYPDFTDIYDI